jgi:DNA-binding response OmpR family regulator
MNRPNNMSKHQQMTGQFMRMQILMIDKDIAAVEELRSGLKGPDMDLLATPSYVEGLGMLAERRFDVVIIDYSITDEGAHTVCSVAKKRDDDTMLIVTSRIQSRELEKKIRGYNPAMYLIKPYAISDMTAVIDRIVKWKNSLG